MAEADRRSGRLHRDVFRLLLASAEGQHCKLLSVEIFDKLGRKRLESYHIEDVEELEQCLKSCPRMFDTEAYGSQVFVRPRTSLTFCPEHSRKAGSCQDRACPNLHFCIFFLLSGQCRYGGKCHFGHEMGAGHNRHLLASHSLHGLSMTELRVLFCLPWVRRGLTLPQVCRYYNVAKGCTKGSDCHCLHICLHYVRETCKFAQSCNRNHEINHPQVKNVLTLYGIKVVGRPLRDVLHEVRNYDGKDDNSDDSDADEDADTGSSIMIAGARGKRFGSKPNLFHRKDLSPKSQDPAIVGYGSSRRSLSRERHPSGGSPGHTAKTHKLCLFHLQGKCRFKDSCENLHSREPFLWLFGAEGTKGREWNSLDAGRNLALEKYFISPECVQCSIELVDGTEMLVNFKAFIGVNEMSGQHYTVKRIAVEASEEPAIKHSTGRQPALSMATVWLWYWRQGGEWGEFGVGGASEHLPVSSEVESRFQKNPHTSMKFSHFILDFSKMRLKDINTGHRFKVRRRPQLRRQNDDPYLEDWYGSDMSDHEWERASDHEWERASDHEWERAGHHDNYPDDRERPRRHGNSLFRRERTDDGYYSPYGIERRDSREKFWPRRERTGRYDDYEDKRDRPGRHNDYMFEMETTHSDNDSVDERITGHHNEYQHEGDKNHHFFSYPHDRFKVDHDDYRQDRKRHSYHDDHLHERGREHCLDDYLHGKMESRHGGAEGWQDDYMHGGAEGRHGRAEGRHGRVEGPQDDYMHGRVEGRHGRAEGRHGRVEGPQDDYMHGRVEGRHGRAEGRHGRVEGWQDDYMHGRERFGDRPFFTEDRERRDHYDVSVLDEAHREHDLFPSASEDEFQMELTPGTEYDKVRKRFTETLGISATVLSIHKVENPELVARYYRKKQLLREMSGVGEAEEKELYYPTTTAKGTTAICSVGVDCNNHKGATVDSKPYGKGGYFFINAAQANKRCKGKGKRFMFVMKCLVGRWGQGHRMCVVPPPIDVNDLTGKTYDSCVDDIQDPRIFVIFDSAQVCPCYLISYQLTKR